MIRYLDYCSETLSMLSKISAFYVQRVQDPDAVSAVQEVQVLAIGLSQKIWQKIAILDRMLDASVQREDFAPGAEGDSSPGVPSA